jgi:hypothetical protein
MFSSHTHKKHSLGILNDAQRMSDKGSPRIKEPTSTSMPKLTVSDDAEERCSCFLGDVARNGVLVDRPVKAWTNGEIVNDTSRGRTEKYFMVMMAQC